MNKGTKILQWFYKQSWKKLLGIGMLVFTVAVLPTAMGAALNPTRTRSEAALLPKNQSAKGFEVPTGPPVIYLVDHFFGKTGDAVLVHGENLGGFHEESFVSLGGEVIPFSDLVNWSGDYIEFKVPKNAQSGKVEVSVLGQKASWSGVFFVTDENTEAELRLVDGYLKAKNLGRAKRLLVWILVISGEGRVNLTASNGVNSVVTVLDLPIGKIYQASLGLPDQLVSQSSLGLVNLLKVDKGEEMLIGIARGELDDGKGQLTPLQAHPLFVSF